MPSLHIGWALWCGDRVSSCSRATWVRIARPAVPGRHADRHRRHGEPLHPRRGRRCRCRAAFGFGSSVPAVRADRASRSELLRPRSRPTAAKSSSSDRRPARRPSGAARRAAVVVDQLAGVESGRVAERPADADQAAPCDGSWSSALSRTSIDRVAHPGRQLPRRRRAHRPPLARAVRASRAARSASRVRGVRSAEIASPCRSCSSWTVHSMSARPPRPSLVCVDGIGTARQPLGVDAALQPADLDEIVGAESGRWVAHRVDQLRRTACPRSASPTANRARSSACASHADDQRA